MANILYFLAALLVFGIIVVAHEFGHYISARMLGIGVVEFSVGFGPKLFGWRRKDIDYSLRAIPLGGYCQFVGEDAENPAPNAMNNQPVWKRFITVFSGPLMNFVLAYVAVAIYMMAFGFYFSAPAVGDFTPDMPAQQAGLQIGDVITAVNGEAIEYTSAGTEKMRQIISQADPERDLVFSVDRGGQRLEIAVRPQKAADGNYQIGIIMGVDTYKYPPLEAVRQAGPVTWSYVTMMVDALKNMFTTGEGMSDTMGPVGVITFMTQEIQHGFDMVLNLILIISLNLGIINLLPLPALDGGRLVFLIIEGIRRKPVKPEHEGWVHAAGFVLLLGLIVVITFRDVARLVTGEFWNMFN